MESLLIAMRRAPRDLVGKLPKSRALTFPGAISEASPPRSGDLLENCARILVAAVRRARARAPAAQLIGERPDTCLEGFQMPFRAAPAQISEELPNG